MKTPVLAIFCVVVAALLGAVGQFLFQAAAHRAKPGIIGFLTSPWVIVGLLCYFVVTALFNVAFKKGGTVPLMYPVYASTYIWAALIAVAMFEHTIRPVHVFGMILLIAGMYFMGR